MWINNKMRIIINYCWFCCYCIFSPTSLSPVPASTTCYVYSFFFFFHCCMSLLLQNTRQYQNKCYYYYLMLFIHLAHISFYILFHHRFTRFLFLQSKRKKLSIFYRIKYVLRQRRRRETSTIRLLCIARWKTIRLKQVFFKCCSFRVLAAITYNICADGTPQAHNHIHAIRWYILYIFCFLFYFFIFVADGSDGRRRNKKYI